MEKINNINIEEKIIHRLIYGGEIIIRLIR